MAGVITFSPIGQQTINTPFAFTWTFTVTPDFEYKDDSGALAAFPVGSSEPPTTPTVNTATHPGFSTSGSHTITLKEAASGATATSAAFTVIGNTESASGTTATPGVGTITLANDTLVTITAGSSLQTQDQVNAIMAAIHTQQVAEVPGGECFSGTCFPQEALAGDIIIADSPHVQATGVRGLLTDKDGNVWGLVAGIPADTNPPAWWWGGIQLNGVLQWSGYNIAIRLTNDGQVWVEEAKQGGWWSLTLFHETGTKTYVADPGAGPNNTSSGGQIKFGNTIDVTTSNVQLLEYWNHLLYQHDSVLQGWWVGTTGAWTQVNASASGTTVTDGTGIILTATEGGSLVTLQGGQVWFNGSVDTTTANATLILFYNGALYHKNTAGQWFTGTKGAWTGPLSGDPRTVVASGNFQVKNGQIIDPSGNVWRGKGVCMTDQAALSASAVLALWPHTNILNYAIGSDFANGATGRGYLDAPSNDAIMAVVNDFTSKGIVVVLSDYVAGQPGPRTGSDLTNMAAWYGTLANLTKTNPYVWFITSNEIAGAVGPMWTATYNAVRGAGNNTIVGFECAWGAIDHTFDSDPAVPVGKTGVIWVGHGYAGNFSPQNDTGVRSIVNLWQTFAQSADGVMPVFAAEQGPSSNGTDFDDNLLNGTTYQVMQAIDDVTTGNQGDLCANTAWVMSFNGGGYNGGDAMLQPNTIFSSPAYTTWGTQVKTMLAANPPG